MLARFGFLATGIGVLVVLPVFSLAADQPVATAVCSGTFEVDGSTASNTANLFQGSKIASTTGACTLQKPGGASIRLEPQSEIVLTSTGLTLTRGTIRIKGNIDLGIASGKSVIHPADSTTIINARFQNNQFLVNVAHGSATIAGQKAELYGQLGAGTLVLFSPAPSESSGLYLWVSGCLQLQGSNWLVSDQHIYKAVQLDQEAVRKDGQPVGVWGGLEELPAASPEVAARLRVVQENPTQQACQAFTASSNLDGTAEEDRRRRDAVIAVFLAGFGALEWASQPGRAVSVASIP